MPCHMPCHITPPKYFVEFENFQKIFSRWDPLGTYLMADMGQTPHGKHPDILREADGGGHLAHCPGSECANKTRFTRHSVESSRHTSWGKRWSPNRPTRVLRMCLVEPLGSMPSEAHELPRMACCCAHLMPQEACLVQTIECLISVHNVHRPSREACGVGPMVTSICPRWVRQATENFTEKNLWGCYNGLIWHIDTMGWQNCLIREPKQVGPKKWLGDTVVSEIWVRV